MSEELLYYVWKFGLFDTNLQTDLNESLSVFTPGVQNISSGPDFTNSKIKVGNQTWFGNVEIHVKSSDWNKHGHKEDRAYDSIILHVVYEKDCEIDELVFRKIPTLELKNFINKQFVLKYNAFVNQNTWIPCQDSLGKIDSFIVDSWLDRLSIERIERKTQQIEMLLNYFKGNWEKTFITWLSTCFGFKINALPFELLGKSIKVKHLINSNNVEALLLGISGLIPENSNDYYVNEIQKVFDFEKLKWDIVPLNSTIWKKGGVRPYNQPELRIAQLAAVLSQNKSGLLSHFLTIDTLDEVEDFLTASPSNYWKNHFSFNSISSKEHKTTISTASKKLLIVNAVIPFLFFYGKTLNKEGVVRRALKFMEEIPSEKNSIISKWKELGIESRTVSRSQALLELYNQYCCVKKCLICSIGNKVLMK
ncbi:MAG: DUF2851 family protein [Salibacteraceae bacterium]